MRPRYIKLAAIGAITATVLRLDAADLPPDLSQAEDSTCPGKWEDPGPRTGDCKRDWIFGHCTTFAIEHEAAFAAIQDCTLDAELFADYCEAIPPWCQEDGL
jgi:hypothetical protein